MEGFHFTTMYFGQESFIKVNGRLLKNKNAKISTSQARVFTALTARMALACVSEVVRISHYVFFTHFFLLATHSGIMYIRHQAYFMFLDNNLRFLVVILKA